MIENDSNDRGQHRRPLLCSWAGSNTIALQPNSDHNNTSQAVRQRSLNIGYRGSEFEKAVNPMQNVAGTVNFHHGCRCPSHSAFCQRSSTKPQQHDKSTRHQRLSRPRFTTSKRELTKPSAKGRGLGAQRRRHHNRRPMRRIPPTSY